ncbi:hypothetical protein OF83DRAFT_1172786 [Amylostereum chailletii]|nr:hypothetical protein OF83DRAFT_1172786 [Amylostereum chailletii]
MSTAQQPHLEAVDNDEDSRRRHVRFQEENSPHAGGNVSQEDLLKDAWAPLFKRKNKLRVEVKQEPVEDVMMSDTSALPAGASEHPIKESNFGKYGMFGARLREKAIAKRGKPAPASSDDMRPNADHDAGASLDHSRLRPDPSLREAPHLQPSRNTMSVPAPRAVPSSRGGFSRPHEGLSSQESRAIRGAGDLAAPALRGESVRGESVRGESVRGESVRGESVRRESVRGESVRGESVRGESVRGESVRGESVRGESVRGESVRGEWVRGDSVCGEPVREGTPAGNGPSASGDRAENSATDFKRKGRAYSPRLLTSGAACGRIPATADPLRETFTQQELHKSADGLRRMMLRYDRTAVVNRIVEGNTATRWAYLEEPEREWRLNVTSLIAEASIRPSIGEYLPQLAGSEKSRSFQKVLYRGHMPFRIAQVSAHEEMIALNEEIEEVTKILADFKHVEDEISLLVEDLEARLVPRRRYTECVLDPFPMATLADDSTKMDI